jgi:hypothetical protein
MENKTNKKIERESKSSKRSQVNKLATLLGIGGLDGSISLAAIAGFFRPENAFLLSVLFIAGPGAILTALTLDGTMKQRILAAFLACAIATIIIVLAAGVGTKALGFLNLNIIKIAGGIAILLIGLLIMGIKLNENLPIAIMLLGLIAGAIWR